MLIEAASVRTWNDRSGKAAAIFGALGVVNSQLVFPVLSVPWFGYVEMSTEPGLSRHSLSSFGKDDGVFARRSLYMK